MGPKKDSTTPLNIMAPTTTTPDIAAQLAELTRAFERRFDKLEGMLKEVRQENGQLRRILEDRDKEIYRLRDRLNELEQYGRGWSIRILNLKVPEEDASNPAKVMQLVYQQVLLPILQGAKDKGQLHNIPAAEDLLETAHILPAKPDAINPIIARFYTRNLRNLVLRLKKDYAARQPTEPGRMRSGPPKPGKYIHPIYEDLTRQNFQKMRAISQHESVEACWSVNGALKFKLKNSANIKRVKSVFATVEEILAT